MIIFGCIDISITNRGLYRGVAMGIVLLSKIDLLFSLKVLIVPSIIRDKITYINKLLGQTEI